MAQDWRIPAGGLPNIFWDWNRSPSHKASHGSWKEPAVDYPDAVERGIILLWCDDTIVPPVGQLVGVGEPDDHGQCEWTLIGPEFDVKEWLYDGRVQSYEDATRCELATRIPNFVLSPNEYSLESLVDHAQFMSWCEISHPLLTDIVMIHAKQAGKIADRCELLRDHLLQNFQSDHSPT